jgi:hypothetical protein
MIIWEGRSHEVAAREISVSRESRVRRKDVSFRIELGALDAPGHYAGALDSPVSRNTCPPVDEEYPPAAIHVEEGHTTLDKSALGLVVASAGNGVEIACQEAPDPVTTSAR